MRNTIINKIFSAAKQNSNIILITADLGYSVMEKFQEELPNQFINSGIAEQNMIGVAAGLALSGKKVFVYSIVPFAVMRCFEQIRVDICYQNLDVTIIGVGGGFAYGTLGVTHYGIEDIAIMRSLPNMKIMCPADPREASLIFEKIFKTGGPTYIRINRGGENEIYNKDETNLDISKPIKVLDNESEYSIFSCGNILDEAYKASINLLNRDKRISLYSCPSIKPFDKDEFLKITNKTKVIYTIEEHNIIGGLGSIIAEIIAEENLNIRLVRFGINDEYFKFIGKQDYMRDICGISSKRIEMVITKNY